MFLSKILADLGYPIGKNPRNCRKVETNSLAILHGKLYILLKQLMVDLEEDQFVLASFDLSSIGYNFEDATPIPSAFIFEAIVPSYFDVLQRNTFNLYTYHEG